MTKQTKQSHYGFEEPIEFPVNFIRDESGTYVIEVDREIEAGSQFSTAIHVLGMAKQDDQIEIRLSSPGGVVDGTDGFLHALRKCAAHIHIIATGLVASMATHILLEADSVELANGFHALIHTGSGGSWGNMNEIRTQNKFYDDFRLRKFKEVYEGFMSEKETEDVLNGMDLWLDDKQWCERAEARGHYLQKKYEKMRKEQNKAVRKTKKPSAQQKQDEEYDTIGV